MENIICQLCKNVPASLLCKCSNVYSCDLCIGTHFMQVINVKHKPVKYPLTTDSPRNSLGADLEATLHSKLTNELLELEEFRKLSLQKLSELLQKAEQELLETSQRVMVSLNDLCEIAHRDLTTAISLINFRENSDNYILNIFKNCKTAEQVRDLAVVHKSLEFVQFNVAEMINSSICFNLQITDKPSKIELEGQGLQRLTFAMSKNEASKLRMELEQSLEEDEKKISVRNSISNIELELLNKNIVERSVSRVFSHQMASKVLFSQLISRSLYYFLPNTNRIVWFNPEASTFSDIHIPDRMFLKDSAWSLCEGHKIMNTGGYEFQVKDSAFMYDLENKIEIKVPSLPNRRCKHAQVSLGNFVYVIGGISKKGSLKSVDKFNLETGKWRKAGNMSHTREYPGACGHDGKIYIVGGIGVNSIEIYNPLSKKFNLLHLRMPAPGRCCLFSYDDYIIILRADTLTKFIPRTMSCIEKGKVMHCDWTMKGDSYITSEACYFFFFNEVFRLSITENSISFVESIP